MTYLCSVHETPEGLGVMSDDGEDLGIAPLNHTEETWEEYFDRTFDLRSFRGPRRVDIIMNHIH
jgi:hypothetical protein